MKINSLTYEEILKNKENEEIMTQLYSLVRKFCWSKKCHSEDLVQELLLHIWEKIDMFDHNKSKFTTWVFKVCNNKYLMILREENAQKRKANNNLISLNDLVDSESGVELIDLIIDDDNGLSYKHYVSSIIYNELSDLAKKYFSGAKQSDLAKEFNISQSQVSRIVKKEIKQLKRKYDL